MLTCSNNLFLPKYNNFTLNMTKWMIYWIFILLYKVCYLPCFTTSTHLRPSQIHVKAIQSDLYHMPFFWTCHMMRLIHAGRLHATLYIASRHHIHISSQSKRAQAWLLKQNPISLWNVIKAAGSRICLFARRPYDYTYYTSTLKHSLETAQVILMNDLKPNIKVTKRTTMPNKTQQPLYVALYEP